MERKTLVSMAALAALIVADTAVVPNDAEAFFGNMMNPGRWFDDDDDYYYDRYRRGGYGPYGWGGGPYGGYGPYGGGYGSPYGYGGYPGYGGGGYPSTIVVNPSGNTNQTPAPPPPPRLPE